MYDGNLEKDIVTFYVNNMGKRHGTEETTTEEEEEAGRGTQSW